MCGGSGDQGWGGGAGRGGSEGKIRMEKRGGRKREAEAFPPEEAAIAKEQEHCVFF